MKLRKTILAAFILTSTWVFTYSQSANIVNQNQLHFPAESETNRFAISKNDIFKIESIGSELGEIKNYSVGFKKGDVYFMKNMDNNRFDVGVKKNYLESGVGTVMYLEVSIKNDKSETLIKNTYELILTFD